MKKIILFDIDGTLLVAMGTGRRAFDKAFSELHDIKSAWKIESAHGRTDVDLIEEMVEKSLHKSLSKLEFNDLKQKYIKYFEEEISKENSISIMPGAPDLCAELSKNKNHLLGIETGNFSETAELKLQRANLDKYFSYGGYACDSKNRSIIISTAISRAKKSFNLNKNEYSLFVIGDSVQDVIAGKENNATVIAVATGRSSYEDLNKHGADFVFNSLENTKEVLEAIL